jgi:hypothetical protein
MEFFYVSGFILLAIFTVCLIESDTKELRGVFVTLNILVTLLLFLAIISNINEPYENLINECQQHLPRSEKCVLMAVPEYTVGE